MRVIRRSSIQLIAAFVALISAAFAAGAMADKGMITDLMVGTAHDALFGLSFEGDQGVAVGAAGAIFETSDAGKTWKQVNEKPIPASLLAVDWHGKFAIAVGQAGLVLVRVESGEWRRADTGSDHRLFSVSVNRFGTAVAAGEFGTVQKTVDGGVSWTSIAPKWPSIIQINGGDAEPHMYSANITDAGVITIAGEFGLILRSSDGGASWAVLNPGDAKAASVFALYLAPGNAGKSYAVGQSGEILVSANAGANWVKSPAGTQSNFLGVTVGGDGKVVVTGMRVMVISGDEGASWKPIEEGDTTTEWYQAVRTQQTSGKVIAVGHAGKIIAIGG